MRSKMCWYHIWQTLFGQVVDVRFNLYLFFFVLLKDWCQRGFWSPRVNSMAWMIWVMTSKPCWSGVNIEKLYWYEVFFLFHNPGKAAIRFKIRVLHTPPWDWSLIRFTSSCSKRKKKDDEIKDRGLSFQRSLFLKI